MPPAAARITILLRGHTDMTAEESAEMALVLEMQRVGYLFETHAMVFQHQLCGADDVIVYQRTGRLARELFADGREIFGRDTQKGGVFVDAAHLMAGLVEELDKTLKKILRR